MAFFPGWRVDLEDRAYLSRPGPFRLLSPIVNAPETFDPRDDLTEEDQKQQGSCSGHALTTSAELANYLQSSGNMTQLCRQFAYIEGQRIDNLIGQDQGATISGVVQAAKNVGICREELWPYTGQYNTRPPAECYAEAKQHRIANHVPLRSHQDVINFLHAGQGAVVIGIMWTAGLANNKSGTITRSNSGGQVLGGHAIALVGWVKDKIILANSHSTAWGQNGYALCDADWIDRETQNQQSEFIGISTLTETFGEPQSWDWLKNPMPYG